MAKAQGFRDLVQGDLRKRDFRPVYVLEGADTFRIGSVVDSLRELALEGDASFNSHVLHGDQAGWQAVLQQAQAISMFGGRQLVWLRQAERIARDEAGESALRRYLESPVPSTILVISAEKLDRRRAWVKDAQKRGFVFAFEPPKGAELREWARKAAAKAGLDIGGEALQTLCDLVGSDLQALSGEIQKLSLLAEASGAPPTADDIVRVVMDQAELNAFQLTDSLAPGRRSEALRTWFRLAEWGTDVHGLSPLVLAHLRRTALVRALVDDGHRTDEIARIAGLHPWALRNKMLPLAERLGPDGSRRALLASLRCERALKRTPLPPALVFEKLLQDVTRSD